MEEKSVRTSALNVFATSAARTDARTIGCRVKSGASAKQQRVDDVTRDAQLRVRDEVHRGNLRLTLEWAYSN